MKFFLDTASLKDISWAAQAGLIDGVTTNPSLLAKQAGDLDPRDVLKEICSLVEGPVSAEVVAVGAAGTLCFSSVQCLIAAKAGATYVSPFVGRLDDVGQDGMDVIREVRQIFDNYA